MRRIHKEYNSRKDVSDFEVLPGYARRKYAETRSILLHHVLPVYYTLGMSLVLRILDCLAGF